MFETDRDSCMDQLMKLLKESKMDRDGTINLTFLRYPKNRSPNIPKDQKSSKRGWVYEWPKMIFPARDKVLPYRTTFKRLTKNDRGSFGLAVKAAKVTGELVIEKVVDTSSSVGHVFQNNVIYSVDGIVVNPRGHSPTLTSSSLHTAVFLLRTAAKDVVLGLQVSPEATDTNPVYNRLPLNSDAFDESEDEEDDSDEEVGMDATTSSSGNVISARDRQYTDKEKLSTIIKVSRVNPGDYDFSATPHGVRVMKVVGKKREMLLKTGDVILEVNGRPVSDDVDVVTEATTSGDAKKMSEKGSKRVVNMVIYRSKINRSTDEELDTDGPYELDYEKFTLRRDQLRRCCLTKTRRGIVVVAVGFKQKSSVKSFKTGTVIKSINGRELYGNMNTLREALKGGKGTEDLKLVIANYDRWF